jgi:hypothetical protein
MIYEPKRLLVVVKTYPNPSRNYVETVCCAGVDLATGRWVRMYPITFRRLAGKQFGKYQVIDCRAAKPTSDLRPESLHIDQDTISLVGSPMPAGPAGWRRRMDVLPATARSVEAVLAAQAANGTSLAMIRPKEVKGLVIEKAKPWSEKQKAYLRQQHLDLGESTSQQLRELEQIPYAFSYRFTCDDERCAIVHELQVLDWEIGESYRRWSAGGGDWEKSIRKVYEEDLPARDLHFVLGNLHKRQQTFVIIGLVRPPRPQVGGGYIQQSLDLMGQQRPMAGVGVGLEAQQADPLASDDRDEALEFFPDER